MPLPSSPSSRFLSLPESRSSSSTLCPSSPPSSKAHSNSLSSESASRSPPIPLGTDLCHRFVPLHRDRTGDRPGRLVRSLPTVGNGRPPLDPRSCLNQLSPLASPHQHTPRDFPSLPKTPLLPEHRSPPHLPHTLPLPLTPLSSNIIPPRPDHNLPNLVCGTRIFGKYLVDHSFTRLLGPAVSTPSPYSGFECLPDRAFAFILSTTPPRSATDTALPLVTLPPNPNTK